MAVRVKICGLRRPVDVTSAVEEGADAVGFVVGFHASPRSITAREASELRRLVPVFVDAVLVTRAERVEELRRLVEYVSPDALQLYGPLSPSEAREAAPSCRFIKPVKAGTDPSTISLAGVDAVLLDAPSEGLPGGSGRTHDWASARLFRERVGAPLILAGGLNPWNVCEAVRLVRPYAVDVSTGVESSPGVKDRELIRSFINSAKGR